MKDREIAWTVPLEALSLRVSSWLICFREGDLGSVGAPSASIQLQKEDKTYTAIFDAVIQSDGNNPSFHSNKNWMLMCPALCRDGKYLKGLIIDSSLNICII